MTRFTTLPALFFGRFHIPWNSDQTVAIAVVRCSPRK